MIRLLTPWGLYILNNMRFIDTFRAFENEKWVVYVQFDERTHRLDSFCTERDAFVYADILRVSIHELFNPSEDHEFYHRFDDFRKRAYKETTKQGMVE